MQSNNYLTTYRDFFENYVTNVASDDPLPLRVASYTLNEDELLGQVVDCCFQYLNLVNCPSSLHSYLLKLVVDQVSSHYKATPSSHYEPLDIMQTVTRTVAQVCRLHLDNELLSSIPEPKSEPLVSSLGIKHVRRSMEDKLVFITKLNSLFNVNVGHEASYYAVFDGHNGPDAATYASSHLHQFLIESPHYPHNIEEAFREAYKKTDSNFTSKNMRAGTTAVVILHEPEIKRMTVSWIGDSQAMLIKNGEPQMLVNPHRPQREDELKRIEGLGGHVINVYGIYRVNGDLAVSRALGDSQFKPYVSSEPEINVLELDGTEEAIILGCDGFWDVLTPDRVCDTFQFHAANEPDRVDLLSGHLVHLAKEFQSKDNISVIVSLFKPARELTIPLVRKYLEETAMDFPEVEAPFCPTNGSTILINDDFGPETDVDAPEDENPFGTNNWGPPTKPSVFAFDNPFTSNLHDIAEEKSVDEKAEKDLMNGFINGNFNYINENGPPVKTENGFGENPFLQQTTNEHLVQSSGDCQDENKQESEIKKEVEFFDQREEIKKQVEFFDQREEIINKVEREESKSDLFDQREESKSDLFEEREENKEDLDVFAFKREIINNAVDSFDERDEIKNEVGLFDDSEDKKAEAFLKELEKEEVKNEVDDSEEIRYDVQLTKSEEEFLEKELKEDKIDIEKKSDCVVVDESEKVPLETLKSLVQQDDSSAHEELNGMDFPIKDELTPQLDAPTTEAEESAAKVDDLLNSDGIIAAEDVVEPTEEGEESEDEWNFYMVHPSETKPEEVVQQNPPQPEDPELESEVMNSPLNPDAAEFVPGSPPSGVPPGHQTPVKAIPSNLLDDVLVSSPTWANMDAVEVPDVETFIEGAKTRPGDITLDPEVPAFEPISKSVFIESEAPAPVSTIEGIVPLADNAADTFVIYDSESNSQVTAEPIASAIVEEPQQMDTVTETLIQDQFDPIPKIATPEPSPKPTELETAAVLATELSASLKLDSPRGLDCAKDMTSSFIDPSTMGSDDQFDQQPQINGHGDYTQQFENVICEKEVKQVAEGVPAITEPVQVDDLSSTMEHVEQPIAEVKEETAPAKIEEIKTPDLIPEIEKKEEESISAPVLAAAAVATAATATAAVAATAAKKTITKVAAKTTPTKPAIGATKTAPLAASKKPAAATPSKPTATRVSLAPKTAPPPTKAAPKTSTLPPSKPLVSKPSSTTRTTIKATPPPAKPPSTVTAAKPAPPKPITRPLPTQRPRVPSAPTNGIANGDAKKPATTTVTNRKPLSARPGTAPAASRPAPRTTERVPTTRPASARATPSVTTTTAAAKRVASAAPAAAKTSTTSAVKKTMSTATPRPATNGLAKTAPVKKSVVGVGKTDVKTGGVKSSVNGVNGTSAPAAATIPAE